MTDEKSFESINKWMNQIHAHAPVEVKVVLVANKIDLEKERKVSSEEGMQVASKYGIPFYECSAKTGEHVNDVFQKVGSDILDKLAKQRLDSVESQTGANLNKASSNSLGKKCC